MKAIICAGFGLALLSGPVLAQTPPQPAPSGQSEGERDPHMSPPPPPGDHGGWDRDDDEEGRPHGMAGHHRPPPPGKAARFRIEAGDISIGMKCPEDEPLKACADFALQMIDKIGALPHR